MSQSMLQKELIRQASVKLNRKQVSPQGAALSVFCHHSPLGKSLLRTWGVQQGPSEGRETINNVVQKVRAVICLCFPSIPLETARGGRGLQSDSLGPPPALLLGEKTAQHQGHLVPWCRCPGPGCSFQLHA